MREKQTPHSAFQSPYIFLSPHTKRNNNHTQEMSMNHFSTELPEAHWWSHYTLDQKNSSAYHKSLTASHNSAAAFAPPDLYRTAPMFSAAPFDLNNEDDDELSDEHELIEQQEIQKERLFEKPLTPSDVGKLNRLVIPKQQAEKHFPLNGSGESGENGLLLGFEDELGKSWRFRYSYWNSSQSYVLTKGWSRFVKEKRLDAGDIVVFARDRVDTARLFIGWRRRNSISGGQDGGTGTQPAAALASGSGGSAGGAGGWGRILYSGHQYPVQPPSNSVHFQSQSIHAGATAISPMQTTSSAGSGNSKTLRLFGVNLECQADESEPSTPVGSPMSSHYYQPYHPYQYYSNNHMDISFSGAADVYRQG